MAITRGTFPLPDTTDPLTAPFFAAAARDELQITCCRACNRFVWYPEEKCPDCTGALEWAPVSGRATLFTWAVVERAFLPAFAERVPFVTALVALEEDENVRLCTYLVDVPESDFAALRAGSACEVVFRDLEFATVPDAFVRVPMSRLAEH